MEIREYCNETVMGKYTKNDLPIIFGLNPDINEIIIKDAITAFWQLFFSTESTSRIDKCHKNGRHILNY
jgi:hypothetical protein